MIVLHEISRIGFGHEYKKKMLTWTKEQIIQIFGYYLTFTKNDGKIPEVVFSTAW